MTKKTNRRGRRTERNGTIRGTGGLPTTHDSERKRIFFAIGDADYGYTEGKILRLARHFKDQTSCQLVVLTHDTETLEAAKKLGIETRLVEIQSPGVTVEERLKSTDEMIRETADVAIPGSGLLLWKVLAMDDFLSSLQLFGAVPTFPLDPAAAVVVPLMGIDNNTRSSCGLYTWIVSEARRMQIPVIGLEVSPLGNKNTLCHLPADHYAVKTPWSKDYLLQQKLAAVERVSVLKWEESYFLWPGQDDYTEAFVENEAKAREMLNVPMDDFVVLLPHHVAFTWEARKILQALAKLPFVKHVVIRVDPRTTRRHLPEREIVWQSYEKEIRALPHVVIDERIGVGLLLQLADVVIAPFAGTTTERASLCRKPTIVCQAMGQGGARGEFCYWEPHPDNLPSLLHSWREKGLLSNSRLARIVESVIQHAQTSEALPIRDGRPAVSEFEPDVIKEAL
ncbi:MAG TPA: hypothetical protein VIB79_07280 [Candidatus Binatia bacterium]